MIRWDVKAMEDLPEYMKICYLGMFNFANEVAYDVLKNHGLNILPHIQREVIYFVYIMITFE